MADERWIRVQAIDGRVVRVLGAGNQAHTVVVPAKDAAGIEVALERASIETASAAALGFPVPEAIPYELSVP